MRNTNWDVVTKREMPQKGGHNGISDTFSPKRYNYPPEQKKRLICQPPTIKKILKIFGKS